jgi:sugar/nucleoside kinase (ribokinase family)
MGSKGIRFSLFGGEWQMVAPVPNDNVVDTEGAGDWTTSQFIACLCEKDILSISRMTEQNIRECLEKASETASRSVSYLSSKGMIDEELQKH